MNTQRFFITGGAGFIGAHLVRRLLAQGTSVVVLDALTYAGNLANLAPWIESVPIILPTFGETFQRAPVSLQDTHWEMVTMRLLWPSYKVPEEKILRVSVPEDLSQAVLESLGHYGFAFVWADILSRPTLSTILPEIHGVFHLAAETHVDRSILSPEPFWRTDLWGTLTLLEVLREIQEKEGRRLRLLHVSTDEVYGEVSSGTVSESAPLNPSNPYAAAKAAADRLVATYVRTYSLEAVIARPSNIYGPYQHPEKLIPQFVLRALQGYPLPLYGDGQQRRTWLFVEDAVEALLLLWEKGTSGEAYNVPGPEEKANLEIAKKILEYLGQSEDLIRFVQDRPGHDRRYAMAGDKIRALGWSPKIHLDKGLKTTVRWYAEHRKWWKPLWRESESFWKQWYGSRLSQEHHEV